MGSEMRDNYSAFIIDYALGPRYNAEWEKLDRVTYPAFVEGFYCFKTTSGLSSGERPLR
jgi:hypothetical protein